MKYKHFSLCSKTNPTEQNTRRNELIRQSLFCCNSLISHTNKQLHRQTRLFISFNYALRLEARDITDGWVEMNLCIRYRHNIIVLSLQKHGVHSRWLQLELVGDCKMASSIRSTRQISFLHLILSLGTLSRTNHKNLLSTKESCLGEAGYIKFVLLAPASHSYFA